MYGVTGKVTNEVKKAVENISKNSSTRVWIHISGGGTKLLSTESNSSEPDDSGAQLLEIKKQADQFYQELKEGKHRYRRL